MTAKPLVACPVCSAQRLHPFFEMPDVPIHSNLLWSDETSARQCPRGDIHLAFCPECGFMTNLDFDQNLTEYTQTYENSLHFSAHFQEYARNLAQQLVEKYQLYNKGIIEIGSGKGDFLMLLSQLGRNRCWGFDPSYVERKLPDDVAARITFIRGFYSERHSAYEADLVCCRQTLEHIQYPARLLRTVRRAIGHRVNTAVFFEVPNALSIFQTMAVWDIIYEHCCYFTPRSLARVFTLSGFEVKEITEAFGKQYLCLHAFPASGTSGFAKDTGFEAPSILESDITNFASRFEQTRRTWQSKIEHIRVHGQRAVLWGAGSKGVTFLNLCQTEPAIRYVVDINPRKQGKYLAGTGQLIVPPEFLRDYRPDFVFIMNPVYRNEIRDQIENLNLRPELFCAMETDHAG